MKRLIIVGAGISGISLARMLRNHIDITILEKTATPGGLVKCDTIDGILFHKVGGHVFNTKNDEVLKWFWEYFDRDLEFIRARRNANIYLDRKYIGYPLENHLYQLDPKTMSDAFQDLLITNASRRKVVNFEDFLKVTFGMTLYNLYFYPYNSKLWNTDLSTIPLGWLAGKLPMPNLHQIIISNITRSEEMDMVHSAFFYPKNSGSQYIVNRLAEGLNIQFNSEVRTIESRNNKLVVNGEIYADYIVYTGDVRQLNKIYGTAARATGAKLEKVTKLKSNGTSNVLCKTNKTDLSWLYVPSPAVKAHRIIYTGNFSPSNNGNHRSLTCVVEFAGRYEKSCMVEEIQKLPGNLRPIAFNYEQNSYVVQDGTTRDHIKQLKDALSKDNMFLLGRFAEWEYYNMDKCIESAMNVREKILTTLNN
jgi:protoporphyrinogen oxidase